MFQFGVVFVIGLVSWVSGWFSISFTHSIGITYWFWVFFLRSLDDGISWVHLTMAVAGRHIQSVQFANYTPLQLLFLVDYLLGCSFAATGVGSELLNSFAIGDAPCNELRVLGLIYFHFKKILYLGYSLGIPSRTGVSDYSYRFLVLGLLSLQIQLFSVQGLNGLVSSIVFAMLWQIVLMHIAIC